MKQPEIDIVGIGAPQSGVGVVMELLATHPAVVDEFPVTTVFTDGSFSRERVEQVVETLPRHHPGQLRGVLAPAALMHRAAPERIARTVPRAKLIVVVRNPLERLVVAYQDAKRRGLVPAGESCALFASRHRALQTDGMYGQWLSNFAPYYAPHQLQVVVYEDLRADPLKTMQSLFQFLEIDAAFIPAALAHYAPPPDEPKHRSLLGRLIHFMYSSLKARFAKPPHDIVPPPLNLATHLSQSEQHLYRQAYAADTEHLSYVLHRDLTELWGLKPRAETSEPGDAAPPPRTLQN